MIEYYYKKKFKSQIEKISEYIKGSWINVVNPSKEEIEFIIEKFNVSEPKLIDGLDIHENPRFEIEDKKTYIYLTAPTSKVVQEYDSSFLIIYAKDYFMTVSKYSLELFDKILKSKIQFEKFDNSRNIVKILFVLSRMFEMAVHKILKETKENRTDLSKLKTQDIERLINHEDQLNNYITSFGTTIGTYQRILRDRSIKFIRKDEKVIEDLIIDLNETLNLCKQTLRTISNMRDYYSTKLSNDLNKTVKVLTMATIFLSIPTLLSSIYGMNVSLPFQNAGYLLPSLLLIAIFLCGVFWVFIKNK
ncbi:MAG: magnesium transporter CorA family protein [Nanoarchaeota archaeon]|jgi:magnesium transporter|nr:magnesium transporter CorA family protein [Nanoarchaeota archaeon]